MRGGSNAVSHVSGAERGQVIMAVRGLDRSAFPSAN
jgi:hypothetical protein